MTPLLLLQSYRIPPAFWLLTHTVQKCMHSRMLVWMLHSSRVISTRELACLQHKIQLEASGKNLIKRLWKERDWALGFITHQTLVLLNHQERSWGFSPRMDNVCLLLAQSCPWQQAWEGKVFNSKLVIEQLVFSCIDTLLDFSVGYAPDLRWLRNMESCHSSSLGCPVEKASSAVLPHSLSWDPLSLLLSKSQV